MNTNRAAAKASVGYTIGNILIRGLSFLTLPIFTRLMTTSDFGLFTTYVAYESILSIIVSLGLYASLKAAKVKYGLELDKYLSSVQLLPLIVGVGSIVIAIPFMRQMGDFFGFCGYIVILMVVQALSSGILTMYNCRVGLDFAYKSYVGISLVQSLGNVLLSLFLILTVFRYNPFIGRVLGTSIPLIFVSGYVLWTFFKRSKPQINKEYFKFGLEYSLPLIPHGLSQILLAQFGKIIIQRQVGNDAAGIYGFAYTVALIPQILMQSLDMAWGPWFFETYKANRIDEIKYRTNQYVRVFAIISIALILVSPELVKLMAGHSYWESIKIAGPAILGVFFTFMYGIPAQIEYYYAKTNYIAMGTMLAAVLNIGFCLWLIPIFGYQAAVYITVVTYILYFVFHLIIAYRVSGKKLPFDLRTTALLVLTTCLVCFFSQLFLDVWYLRYAILVCVLFSFYNTNKALVDNFIFKKIKNQ